MRKLAFVVLFTLLSIDASAIAHAGEPPATPSTLLKRGIELQRQASWSASIAMLEKARAAGVLARAEQIECAFYLAAAYVAVGSDGAARRELTFVLDAQPGFEPPPYTSPKVTSLLGELARTRQQGPSLEARPPRTLSGAAAGPGGASAIELGFEARRAPTPIYGVVRFRLRGQPAWRDALLQSRGVDGTLIAEVRPGGSGVLQYYAHAMSAAGALSVGSPAAPLELPYHAPAGASLSEPAPPARPARAPSKWVWAAIPVGVVLGVATGLGLYYGLSAR